MPLGVFKLTSITPPYHSRKLPTNNLLRRTLTTTNTSSGRRLTHPNPTSTVGWEKRWHWCRISTCAPSAHLKVSLPSTNPISSSTNNRSNHIKVKKRGFGGQNFSHSSNPLALALASTRENRRGYNSQLSNDTSGIGLASFHMGPTPSVDDGWRKPPPPPPSNSSAKFLTLPTILTIGRVAAVPLLVATFYADSWWGPNVTTGIFIAAAITDWLDGYLARKMNQGTAFGAFLDPVADKLMVAATLVLLCTKPLEAGIFGQAPWLLTVPAIAIIGREITMSAVREWAASQDGKLSEAVAVNNLGKWKTATQMTALTILLATRDSSLTGAGTLVASGVVLMYISAWLSVWSLVVYMRKIWKVLLM